MTYSEMKDSGVFWIGKIPAHWKITRSKVIFQNVTIKNHPDATVLSLYRDLGVLPKESRDDNHNVTSEDTAQYKFVEAGNLVINKMKAWQGSLAVSGYSGIVSPAYYVCKFRSEAVDKRYVHYLLRSAVYAQEFQRLSTGMRVGQWDLGIDDFLKIPILLPDTNEQKSIADFLNAQCAEIDAIIEEAKASIEEYKRWKASVIYQAVTKGLDPDAEIQDCEIEWIGASPTTWQILRVKYLLTEINVRSEHGNEPPLSMSQVHGLVPSEMISVANPATSFVGAKIVNPDDLVFNKLKAHLGVFAVSDYYGLVSPDYAVYRANNRVLPKFLEYLFKTPRCITEFKKYISGVGAGLSRLYTSDLFNIHVALPPMREQIQIVSYLDKLCSEIGSVISEKESLISELEAYKKSLIYEAVTGKRKVG